MRPSSWSGQLEPYWWWRNLFGPVKNVCMQSCFISKRLFLSPISDHNLKCFLPYATSWSCTNRCISPVQPLASHRRNKRLVSRPTHKYELNTSPLDACSDVGAVLATLALNALPGKQKTVSAARRGCQRWLYRTHSSDVDTRQGLAEMRWV